MSFLATSLNICIHQEQHLAFQNLLADRHIDCAAAYGNENAVGEAFGNIFKEGKVSRKDVWITSKLNNPDHGRVREACQQTIKELQAEYLDLYLMHWPLTGNKGQQVEPPIKVSLGDLVAPAHLVKGIFSASCALPLLHHTQQMLLLYSDIECLYFRTPGKKWKSW